jgi:two-component system response regulator RegA
MSFGVTEHPTLLVVDDDAVLRDRLVRAFRDRGYESVGAPDGEKALELAANDPPEFAVIDLRMPGRSGLDVVRELLALEPATGIVVLTGYGSIATAVEAIRLGAKHYLTKPADADEILRAFHADDAAATLPTGSALTAPGAPSETETPSLARTEWEHIQRVLADVNGNVSEAARRLGLHRRSLQRKLSKYPPQR